MPQVDLVDFSSRLPGLGVLCLYTSGGLINTSVALLRDGLSVTYRRQCIAFVMLLLLLLL